jgi:ABC-type uncharacterized transport system permease subunit
VMDADQRNLYGGTAKGEILWWSLGSLVGGQPGGLRLVSAGPSAITALDLLIGGRSLVVGQESGALSVWLQVRESAASESFR